MCWCVCGLGIPAPEEQATQAACAELTFAERLGLLLDREMASRDTRRLTRLLQLARLKHPACLKDLDTRPGRGLARVQIGLLATADWICHGQSVIATGPTGTGKTWLACAPGP